MLFGPCLGERKHPWISSGDAMTQTPSVSQPSLAGLAKFVSTCTQDWRPGLLSIVPCGDWVITRGRSAASFSVLKVAGAKESA
jgi:hypothetical protein